MSRFLFPLTHTRAVEFEADPGRLADFRLPTRVRYAPREDPGPLEIHTLSG